MRRSGQRLPLLAMFVGLAIFVALAVAGFVLVLSDRAVIGEGAFALGIAVAGGWFLWSCRRPDRQS